MPTGRLTEPGQTGGVDHLVKLHTIRMMKCDGGQGVMAATARHRQDGRGEHKVGIWGGKRDKLVWKIELVSI